MEIIKIENNLDFIENNLNFIVRELLKGKIFVFPTETSYGLGCDATQQSATDQIFRIKGRNSNKPLLVVVPSVAMAKHYLQWNELLDRLAIKYWPGPLTIVSTANKHPSLPSTPSIQQAISSLARGVIAADGTVAVRVTADPLLQAITEKLGRPLVATSANLADSGDNFNPELIAQQFSAQIHQPDFLIDGGILPIKKPTTLVLVKNNAFSILRQGELEVV